MHTVKLSLAISIQVILSAGTVSVQDVGPRFGTVVAVGGNLQDVVIVERFLQLAGGHSSPIVFIPTAGGAETYDQSWSGLDIFRAAKATDLTVIHTHDRVMANSSTFVEPLLRARGVWFGGGRQWRLADAYLHTKTQQAIRAVLDRGGVIGGSSAGATILGSYLTRGDTRTNTIMMGDHEEGMGFIKNVAIDQHLLRRNRHFDLLQIVRTYPDILGIGIDEDTAIVVRGDQLEVIGQSYVAIYDHSQMLESDELFYFLAPGDRYNLSTRRTLRPGASMRQSEYSRIK